MVVATFEGRSDNADYGKLLIDITNDIIGSETIKIAWGVTGPSGVLKEYDAGTPDFTGVAPAAVTSVEVDIPVVGSYFEQGDYLVQVRITRNAGDALLAFHSETYDYSPFTNDCGDVVTTAFSQEVYCVGKALIVKDGTTYGAYTADKTITVVHPTIAGVVTPEDTVETSTPFQINIAYRNVSYSVIYNVELTLSTELEETDDPITFVENHLIVEQFVVPITCVDLCDIQGCIDDKIRSLKADATAAGGIHNLEVRKRDQIFLIGLYNAGYVMAAQCGDTAKITYYYNLLKDLVDCSANCCDDNKVTEIPAYGEITYIHGTDGDDGDSAYQIWLAEGNVGDEAAFLASLEGDPGDDGDDGNTILSGSGAPDPGLGNDGDLYWDFNGPAIYGPKSGGAWEYIGSPIYLDGTVTDWEDIDSAHIEFPWQSGAGDSALMWRRNGRYIEVKGNVLYNSVNPGALATVAFLGHTFLPAGVSPPDRWFYGFMYDRVNHIAVGVIKEPDVSDGIIYFARTASFVVATTYRVSFLIPIEE